MIYPHALKRAQRRKTQKNFCIFNTLNGISYMCLGETIIVLFAIKLNAPNALVAALGATIYFAFFMLPLGKLVTARVGAARSQAIFWTLRNFVAVGVALSAVTAYYGYQTLALVQILLGACLFYGLRAAGVVMLQPFIGDMATSRERASFLGISNALFYGGCMGSLAVIWAILSYCESIWVIMSIIICGACVGVTSTRYIRRMDESQTMIEAARRAIMPDIREAFKIPVVRKLIWAMFAVYMGQIMLTASSVLCVKRGYGVSDTAALAFSLMQFLSSAIFSFASGRITNRIGVRNTLFLGFGTMLAADVLWLLMPGDLNYIYPGLIFMLMGGAFVICNNSMVGYYLQCTPERLWVATSMLTSVVTSVGAGVIGMIVSSTLFKIIDRWGEAWEPLNRFKVYFALAAILLGMLSLVVWSLPETTSAKEK